MTETADSHAPPTGVTPPRGRAAATDSLAAGLMFMLALTVGQRLIGFLRSVLFCGLLEDDELGRWSLAFSFLLMAAPLAVAGLPGSFGRYVEYYRGRGQLGAFLRRTVVASVLLATVAIVILTVWAPTWAWLVLGDASLVPMMRLLTLTLVAVIGFNFITELLTAARQVRAASIMWFVSSVVFAGLSVVLLLGTSLREQGVVIAFGVSLLVALAFAIHPLRRVNLEAKSNTVALAQSDLWAKLLPFATWIWLTNLLANLFDAADRFMIVHLATPSLLSADALVGQYHASRVVPYLLITLATMVGGVILPYMSRDWESGDRRAVRVRQQLMLKLGGVGLTACGTCVLLGAPVLFTWVLGGKYDHGLAVLPLTLTYCVWFSLLTLAQNYLWCAEKARLATTALCVGLALNIGLNLVLLPRWGLIGAVSATAAGNLTALALVLVFSHRHGMRFDRGSLVCCALPATLMCGPMPAVAALLALGLWELRHGWIFDASDRAELAEVVVRYTGRLQRVVSSDSASTASPAGIPPGGACE